MYLSVFNEYYYYFLYFFYKFKDIIQNNENILEIKNFINNYIYKNNLLK